MEANRDQHPLEVSPDELERERLRTYLDWGEVRAPWWYWPSIAFAVSAWLIGIGYGSAWSLPGALLVALVAGLGVRVMAERGQVSMPRFQGMPTALARAYAPVVVAAVWMVAVLLVVVVSDGPRLVLGAVTGPLMALAGAWTSLRYRRAADRLAATVGMDR